LFNATEIVIDAFVTRIETAYRRNYGRLDMDYGDMLGWAARMALERIAQTDAPYHDMDHTIMVTLVGQEVLRGKHMREGGVAPLDWLHFVISLLCHDIGYVRGICRSDETHAFRIGQGDETVTLAPGATDASLTPYHVDRGKLFVRERFEGHHTIDADIISRNIELTRFPVPDEADRKETDDYPGLVRAADLIGQLADPNHLRKLPSLFVEFEETGQNAKLGFKTSADLRADYPRFFWSVVYPYIQDGLRHLSVTQEGKLWTANLYAQVFATEHESRP
jgi:hypothetical protein